MSDIAQHIEVSQRLQIDDLDWETARKIGLSPQEIESLSYFVDVESQTVYYFLEVVKQRAAREQELLTFLTMWNYEEYFHSHALSRLLAECGVALDADRSAEVRAGAGLQAALEDALQTSIARVMPEAFIALWMFWGALQELLTAHAYEEMGRATRNPVLAELCRRITKQERRHFAYYYGQARERLAGRPVAQRMIRWLAERFYEPVGRAVKSDAERARLVAQLFPGNRIFEVMSDVERRMEKLPGMTGLDCCTRWAAKVQPMLPVEMRVAAPPSPSAVAA